MQWWLVKGKFAARSGLYMVWGLTSIITSVNQGVCLDWWDLFLRVITSRCLQMMQKNSYKIITIKGIHSFFFFQSPSLPFLALAFTFLSLSVSFSVFLLLSPLFLSLADTAELGAREMNLAWIILALGEKAPSKTSLMWLWWMCGTKMCNLPVGVIADKALMSFPKTWRISECTLATNA